MKLLTLMLLLVISSVTYGNPTVWVDQGGAVAARSASISETADRIFNADLLTLQQLLDQAPHESTGDRSHIITLPMPDGSVSRFQVVESPIVQPVEGSSLPDIKTFRVFGMDDPGAIGRVNYGPQGFRGMVFTSQGRVFIDPASDNPQTTSYASGYAGKMARRQFSCGVDHMMDRSPVAEFVDLRARGALARAAGELLVYRVAVSATRRFANQVGPDDIDVLGRIVAAIDAVNVIYERDLGIRLHLVFNDGRFIEQSIGEAFTDSDPFALLNQNTAWINSKISSADYDVGHVFALTGGGLAQIESVCQTSTKAKGYSGLGTFDIDDSSSTKDRFFIDFVAHELGHQFGAEHTFNGTTEACGNFGARIPISAVEPGSGSTIMGYSGICGVEDLQTSSDATFHAASISQINSFVNGGGNCSATSPPIGNPNSPVIDPIANKTIPKGTSFYLDIAATDADLTDTLSYQWDQMDSGTATDAVSFGTDLGDNALFRTYEPRSLSRRDFPSIDTQVRGWFDEAEVLPCRSRELNFRATARDGRSEKDTEDVKLTVDGNSGPFKITNFNTFQSIDPGDGPVTLQWDVANTYRSPIACTRVDIDLLASDSSVFSDYSVFPLEAMVNNVGSAQVTILPSDLDAEYARFRVTCSDNYFYDISDGRLQITGGNTSYPLDAFDSHPNENGATLTTVAPDCPALDTSSRRSSGGGGSVSWLIPLFGIVGLLRRQFRVGNGF